ncbi:Ger(x)C family spore germination protein [Brevibacillus nitrificans]|uniref:Ger(X)C family spore germination protein n=1 Tax=Brevibacillus nitrificans TaxID=651560 RepID=A0A3M8DDP8_9BACL|nr:Ger(x)C family spore germination protein [Brevibacillus nitrificans]RNB85317.1 Ger(x)C family spore germination protein [Brevibacillus nitrificans]
MIRRECGGSRSLYKIALIVLCLLVLTGCWSRRELNDLMIVLGIGIDWEDGQYLVSFQVVNPSQISMQKRNEDRSPSSVFQGRGRTIFEAARSLTAEAPRKVYMGHLQMYVISEELARKGISDLIDNSIRDNENRMDFNVVIARGVKAQDILRMYTPLEELPTDSMQQSLRTSEKTWAPTVAITLDEVMNRLSGQGQELALTGINLIGSPEMGESKKNIEKFFPPSRLRYEGIAVFKKDKLIGWLNQSESKGYTDITDKLQSTSVEIPCGSEKYVGIEITSSKTELETKLSKGKPEITIHMRTHANVVDRVCKNMDLSKPETITRLQEETGRIVQKNSEEAVIRTQELKSDILGFGSKLEKQHPEYWEKIKDRWNEEIYPQLVVHYDCKVTIRQTGTIGNSTMRQ